MMSVIIPAHNEGNYLNRTIDNIFKTAFIAPEVLVIDQGGNGEIDPRATVINPGKNVGERVAMNLAAKQAKNEFLLRIDAHCDFSPAGWDVMMTEVTDEKTITVAVLTALDKEWNRLKGHWYGLCRLLVNEDKGLECKWQKPNRDHTKYNTVEPNMGLTGCGFMIRKRFYEAIGGADESLPAMGAIGEEFAIKAWAHGGKVQTRTDVMIGHIFGTGGYDTSGVKVAQQKLYLKYQAVYPSVAAQFPEFEGMKLIRTDQPGKPLRTVDVIRTDTSDTKDAEGKLIRRRVTKYRYVWVENEHPDERNLTQEEIEKKYAPRGTQISEEILYSNSEGLLVPEAIATLEPAVG